jgi:hypothetical protein
MRKVITVAAALVMAVAMVRAASMSTPKPSSASKSGAAVAYAKADILTQTVLSFGGKGTTAAAVSGGQSNSFIDVKFTGKYPKDVTVDQVIINATAQSSDFGVANATVVSASPSQLVVEVSGWVSTNTDSNVGETVFMSVFLGF